MVKLSEMNRKFERFIGYDAYNNTEAYSRKIRRPHFINEEDAIPFGRIRYNLETGKEEWIKYVINEKGDLIDPITKEVIRKNIEKKLKK